MASYMASAAALLESLISALVDCLAIPWVSCLMLLVVCAFVVNLFRRLT